MRLCSETRGHERPIRPGPSRRPRHCGPPSEARGSTSPLATSTTHSRRERRFWSTTISSRPASSASLRSALLGSFARKAMDRLSGDQAWSITLRSSPLRARDSPPDAGRTRSRVALRVRASLREKGDRPTVGREARGAVPPIREGELLCLSTGSGHPPQVAPGGPRRRAPRSPPRAGEEDALPVRGQGHIAHRDRVDDGFDRPGRGTAGSLLGPHATGRVEEQ